MKNSHIILIAHGSNDFHWRVPFDDLTLRLKKEMGRENISLVYLDSMPPTFLKVISESVNKGFNNFIVLPLFMSRGGHVKKDIPEKIKEVKKKFPKIKIKQLPPIGENPEIFELTKKIAASHIK